MSVFLERLSMWNMLSCAEQVQIQKYNTLKATGVKIIMLKQPTKHKQKKKRESTHKTQTQYQRTEK